MFRKVESYGERITTRRGRPCVLTISIHQTLFFTPLRPSKSHGVILETHWDNSLKASVVCSGERNCPDCVKRPPIPKLYLTVFALYNVMSAVESTPRLLEQLADPPANFGRIGVLEVTAGLMDLWETLQQGVWYKGFKAKPIANARCLIRPLPNFPELAETSQWICGEVASPEPIVRAVYGVKP